MPYVKTESNEGSEQFSPDGKYVVHSSDEYGRMEVYVRTFPEEAGRRQLSYNGGREPRWSKSGREIFFLEGNNLMMAGITREPEFQSGAPSRLFEIRDAHERYDVSADAERFYFAEAAGEPSQRKLIVVQNWYEEFRESQ